ncbi:CatB-related O-acetyltransferase [uncultured Zobellia sp.]|uniref:CatB-related O-acetyltransferase n=1 Tax=uncultured Zobellia sp. TaxID=255433 RepID=UPI002597891A|nr:CatB-related O-acetyltransferase [uncultured Zobellia sp.]
MKPFKFLSLRRNCKIAKTAKVYAFSKISNTEIGDFSYISFRCTINGCTMGKFCSIASGVKIGLGNHPIDFLSTSPLFYTPNNPLRYKIIKETTFPENQPVHIGHDVWVGTNVVILDGVRIGNGAIIGANSIVTKDVPPYTIVGGVPAKTIKNRFSNDIINVLENLKWWQMPIVFFKQEKVKRIFSKPIDKDSIKLLTQTIETYQSKHTSQ